MGKVKRKQRGTRFSDEEWKAVKEAAKFGTSEFVREAVKEKIERGKKK